MTRYAALLGLLLMATGPLAQRKPPLLQNPDLVELDVVVLDKQSRPVSGLTQQDFQIKDDGRPVEIKTFAAVTTAGSARSDDARVVALMLDDTGIPMAGTHPMRSIAQIMLSPSHVGDEVSVVRLSNRSDEAFGDQATALARIEGYHGGVIPYSRRDSGEYALKMVAKMARTLEPIEHRRKLIVCIGVRSVCDVEEPEQGAVSPIWPAWVDALGATARANVSVYGVDPTGLSQRSFVRGVGLARLTGGELFANSNDFGPPAAAIWSEASTYYLLGYWPPVSTKDLHSIDVKVGRKDAHVRSRQRRGA
jgi:VWFA-related protein